MAKFSFSQYTTHLWAPDLIVLWENTDFDMESVDVTRLRA